MNWTECPPQQAGVDTATLDRAVNQVHARKATAQLCVLRDGQVVLDRQFGCTSESLFPLFSVSKPFVALIVHLLAQRGHIRLDDPVARHWPGYTRYGKDTITIRHVLAHRAGVPFATGNMLGDVTAMTDWKNSVRQAERARPRWPAGQVPAYHVLTYGFILGELVRRVTDTPLPEVLKKELLDPLGLSNIHLGLPNQLWSRRVRVRATSPTMLGQQLVFNRRRTSQAVIPAAGMVANARDLALFYQALLSDGVPDRLRIMEPATLAEATRPSNDLDVDRVLGRPVRWGHGFELGGSAEIIRPMGRHNSVVSFGHNGSSVCNVWADPSRHLVFAYVTNLAVSVSKGLRHQCEISDTILDACTR